jgi:hypothetical protein
MDVIRLAGLTLLLAAVDSKATREAVVELIKRPSKFGNFILIE